MAMKRYEIGYGRPPTASRFQPGNKAWAGRKKRKPVVIAEVVERFLDTRARYTERGRVKAATRRELRIKKVINDAVKGDVKSAEMVLKLLEHEQKQSGRGDQTIRIINWLPDRPGQTADEKTHESEMDGETAAPEWWKPAGDTDAKDDVDPK
jgi:hypothetical protein